MYKFPQKIQDIPPVISVSCGVYHTLVITNEEDLWSFGCNELGQLCLGNKINQLQPKKTPFSNIINISASYHSLFQNDKEEIFGCGSSNYGQLGICSGKPQIKVRKIDNHPPNIIQFCSGYYHSLFLDFDGNVFSIGYNSHGNLGLGHNTNQNTFNQILDIPPIQSIFCIGHSNCLIDFEGNLWCFGLNNYYQFGFGDLNSRNIPTKCIDVVGVSQVASGCCGNHFLIKNFDNQIFVGGNNFSGQLGTGETLSQPKYREMNSCYSSIWGNTQSNRNRAKSARK